MKSAVVIALASIVLVDLIVHSLALGLVTPSLKYSIAVNTAATAPKKIRTESYPAATGGVEICAIWLQSTNLTYYSKINYNYSTPTFKGILNPPPVQTYKDIDVVDGISECHVVAMDSQFWYISGSTYMNYTTTTETYDAIGVSNIDLNGFDILLRKGTQISPFVVSFADFFETKRLSATKMLVAGVSGGDLYIGTLSGGNYTKIGLYTTQAKPTSISMAVYSDSNWVVCAVTAATSIIECVFSRNDTLNAHSLTTPFAPTMTAISFLDCNNLAYVVASKTTYFLNLVDVNTVEKNTGGYLSSNINVFTAMHMTTSQNVTSILVSNTTNVYLDLFTWTYDSTCSVTPVSPPTGPTPSATPTNTISPAPDTPIQLVAPFPPQNSPQTGSSSNSPSSNGTTNPGTPPPSNVEGPLGDGNTPKGVDPVALGVGIAVPVAVLGAGAFLLVFLLKRRNKKNQDKTVANPVKDIDSPPPSVQATDTGVYGNIPSNNTTNNTTNRSTYASLGNVANDSYATASVAIELPEIDKRLHIPYKSLVFIKEIGAGSYGKVFLGEWRGAKVAIKVNNQITDVDGFLAEAKLTLGITPHPNLVQTFGVSLDGPNPCIVLEYCGGGSLDRLLYEVEDAITVEKQREYAMKIAYGLLHLHNNNIVHRDLAARNILLTIDQQPKISDFGMSRLIKEEGSKGQTKTSFGPIRWMAPESLRDRSYSSKSDVWSYGIVVNEIVSRQEPHVNEDQLNIAVKIRDQAVTPAIPSDGDPVLVSVIHKCLKADPKDRPTMEELCQFMRAKLD